MKPFSLSIRQCTEATGLSRTAIYAAIKDGKLTARKAGGRTILLAADVESYVRALPVIARAA